MRGRVKTYFETRGFGFIAPDGGGIDVFFHDRNLRRCNISRVSVGAAVEFESEEDQEGRLRVKTISLVPISMGGI